MSVKVWVKRGGAGDDEALGIYVPAGGTARGVVAACRGVFRLRPSRAALRTNDGIIVAASSPAASLAGRTLELIEVDETPAGGDDAARAKRRPEAKTKREAKVREKTRAVAAAGGLRLLWDSLPSFVPQPLERSAVAVRGVLLAARCARVKSVESPLRLGSSDNSGPSPEANCDSRPRGLVNGSDNNGEEASGAHVAAPAVQGRTSPEPTAFVSSLSFDIKAGVEETADEAARVAMGTGGSVWEGEASAKPANDGEGKKTAQRDTHDEGTVCCGESAGERIVDKIEESVGGVMDDALAIQKDETYFQEW